MPMLASLPSLPRPLFPISGFGVRDDRLKLQYGFRSVEHAVAHFRSIYAPETTERRAVFWMESRPRGRAAVFFVRQTRPFRHRLEGMTANDPDAAKIFIGNSRAGRFMTSICWELYADRERESFLDMGRFDQWDLLRDISHLRFKQLADRGVTPRGNWDFDHLLWPMTCGVCAKRIAVNDFCFDIDSAVCSTCGNRPYLARSINRVMDVMECLSDSNPLDLGLRLVQWLSHCGATIHELADRPECRTGEQVLDLFDRSLVGMALLPSTVREARALVAGSTTIPFDWFRQSCGAVRDALCGKAPFAPEHRIHLDLIRNVVEIIHQRANTTQKN